jgi:hypothetical protein
MPKCSNLSVSPVKHCHLSNWVESNFQPPKSFSPAIETNALDSFHRSATLPDLTPRTKPQIAPSRKAIGDT